MLAKGLGSGYAPIAAMLAPARLVDRLSELTGFSFAYTYNAAPISCATALAVLDEYDRLDLCRRAETVGAHLRERLLEMQRRFRIVGDVRGLGLLMAVELVADQKTGRQLPADAVPTDAIRIHGLRNGLMIYSRRTSAGKYGDWFMVSPPLTIQDAECDELIQRLTGTLTDLQGELESAGFL